MQDAAASAGAKAEPRSEIEYAEYADEHGAEGVAREADAEDADIEAMKRRVAEMEAEAAKLREMNEAAERDLGVAPGAAHPTEDEKMEVDARSVYVGNVRVGADARSTTARRRKRFSSTFSRAARSTA